MASEDGSSVGARVGVVADDRVRDDEAGPGMLDRIWREGLRSCWLLRRELAALSFVLDVVRLGFRTGDESREANGEGVTELLAEDCFEVVPSACATEGSSLGGATEDSTGR